MAHSAQHPKTPSRPDPTPPTFRSGAVARMAGMPVSTLRIWEQRYQAVGPTTAPSGHRLYSAADVERVMLLRQLTQRGHAIGSLAALNAAQLHDLNQARDSATPPKGSPPDALPKPHHAPMRIVVVGQAMAQRLNRPSVLERWSRPLHIVATYDSLDAALQGATRAADAPHTPTHLPTDLLLWHASGLQADAVATLGAVRVAWRARAVAVAYRFAGAAARDALVNAGASVVREPTDDGALVTWLSSFGSAADAAQTDSKSHGETGGASTNPGLLDALALSAGGTALPQRRFDDAALTTFAELSSSMACECPGHVAELLMQIASFESYSAHCAHRNQADAELHHYLHRVAGAARLLFETALERVAVAEGLALP